MLFFLKCLGIYLLIGIILTTILWQLRNKDKEHMFDDIEISIFLVITAWLWIFVVPIIIVYRTIED